MDIAKWSIWKSNWWYICSQIWRSCMHSEKARPGVDCGSAHQLLVSKFRLKLKISEKTTRTARYFWYLIPYEYAVEVTNSFNGLDLVNSVPEELWRRSMILYMRQWTKPSQRKSKARRQRCHLRRLSNSWRKKRSKNQGRKGKVHPTKCRVPKKDTETQEGLHHEQCIKQEEINRKNRDLFMKTGNIKGTFSP